MEYKHRMIHSLWWGEVSNSGTCLPSPHSQPLTTLNNERKSQTEPPSVCLPTYPCKFIASNVPRKRLSLICKERHTAFRSICISYAESNREGCDSAHTASIGRHRSLEVPLSRWDCWPPNMATCSPPISVCAPQSLHCHRVIYNCIKLTAWREAKDSSSRDWRRVGIYIWYLSFYLPRVKSATEFNR